MTAEMPAGRLPGRWEGGRKRLDAETEVLRKTRREEQTL